MDTLYTLVSEKAALTSETDALNCRAFVGENKNASPSR